MNAENVNSGIARAAKLLVFALIAFGFDVFAAEARALYSTTFRELEKRCDFIAVAKPISTKDTDERTNLPPFSIAIPVVGVSTEFEVSIVVKGDTNLKKVVVHHYRAGSNSMVYNGPILASFDPKGTNRFLIFLRREADGRYAPYEQIDPAASSFMELSAPAWDAMSVEDFRRWLNVRKWRSAQALFWGKPLAPEIWPAEFGDSGGVFEWVVNGNVEKLRALLRANPGVANARVTYANQTPLHAAADMGQKAVAELLLEYKADIEAKAYFNCTPLLNAVYGADKETVELLLKHNANVNFQDDSGRSPLHMAAENDLTEIAALLLENKANANLTDREGRTAFHFAACYAHTKLAELLVGRGADINAKDNDGRTPLAFAELHNNQEIVEWLNKHGGTK